MKKKNIILLGAPGVGKGTLAKKLAKKYHIPHISSGEMFRHAIKNATAIGKIVKSFLERGDLVPDEITIKVVKERLMENDCKFGYILDGFPRTLFQAKALQKITEEIQDKINIVINIDIHDKELLIKRIINRRICTCCETAYNLINKLPVKENVCDLCNGPLVQRHDDNEIVFRSRLKKYYEYANVLNDFYRKNDLLFIDLDGTKTADVVFNQAIKLINNER